MSKDPKNSGAHDGDDNDFDLSGFADDAAPAPSKSRAASASKASEEEPPKGKKIIGKPLRADAIKAAARRPGPGNPGTEDHKGGPAHKAGGPGKEGPERSRDDASRPQRERGDSPRPPRGGWEKLPQRQNFRGRDDGFVPRGPRNAGPRDTGARAGGPGAPRGGGRFNDRGDSAGRGPRDFNNARGPAGQGAPRSFPPKTGGHGGPGTGGPAPRYLRNVERVGGAGDHKPASLEIKPFLPLKTDKGRWKESQFLLEGAKNIADALSVSTGGIIQTVLIAEDFDDKELLAVIKKNRIQTVTVSMDDLRNLCETETPQGILAVANFATLRPDYSVARYVTLLDAVQDPGNVGAIMRTSLALGMDAVVLGKGTCDPYNPKVVRSSVGALLRLPFETGEDIGAKMDFLRLKGFSIVATSSHAPISIDKAKLRKKVALIMGNEGAGTGATYLDMADAVVKIPLKNKVESLNVSVAHGILSYQLIHGRT